MDDSTYEYITRKIREAAVNKSKMAMFHLQVLLHADQLTTDDADEFCRRVGVTDSLTTEFRKMLKLSSVMKIEGIRAK